MRSRFASTLAVLFMLLVINSAHSTPVVPGFTAETYASWDDPSSNPFSLTFDPAGVAYLGRNVPGSNEPDINILRVDAGGTPVFGQPVINYEYGNMALSDPDAVIFDVAGTFSGIPGSVLVGGSENTAQGEVWAVSPDQTTTTLWGPTSAFRNPHKMVIDETGRLLFTDETAQKILVSDGAFPVDFATGSPFNGIAIDSMSRVFAGVTDGTIRLYAPDGSLLDPEFTSGLDHGSSALAVGPGGIWGFELFTVSGDNLIRIDNNGDHTILGTGFLGTTDLVFGPDDAMYVSMSSDDTIGTDLDSIIRIIPEPSTIGLFIMGAFCFAVMRTRCSSGEGMHR